MSTMTSRFVVPLFSWDTFYLFAVVSVFFSCSSLGTCSSNDSSTKSSHSLETVDMNEATTKKESATSHRNVVTSDLTKNFRWWAVFTNDPNWKLLSGNGTFALSMNKRWESITNLEFLEDNIRPFCGNEESETYGISFTWADDSVTNNFEMLSKTLADVFYICCLEVANCGVRDISDEEGVILYLAEKLFTTVALTVETDSFFNISDVPSDKCISVDGELLMKSRGVKNCFLYMDDMGVTYTGPLTFNTINLLKETSERVRDKATWPDIVREGLFCASTNDGGDNRLEDGECVKYISPEAYFFYCCCYSDPLKCTYFNISGEMRQIKRNVREWERNTELTVGPTVTKREPDETEISVHYASWVLGDFLLSDPTDKSKIKETYGPSNLRRIHCAEGRLHIASDRVDLAGRLEKVKRHSLRLEHFCIRSYIINFNDTIVRQPNRVEVIYTGGTLKFENVSTRHVCKRDHECEHMFNGEHLDDDILDDQNVFFQIACCCNGQNLCNHVGGSKRSSLMAHSLNMSEVPCINMLDVLAFLDADSPESSIICRRHFDFKRRKEIYLMRNISYYTPRATWQNASDCTREEIFTADRAACGETQVVMQLVLCRCPGSFRISSESGTCDSKFHELVWSKIDDDDRPYNRPYCYEGEMNVSSWSDIGKKDFEKIFVRKRTNDTPLCFDEVIMNTNSFEPMQLRSGAVEAGKSKRRKRVGEHELGPNTKAYYVRCFTTSAKICNGPENYKGRVLPHLIKMTHLNKESIQKQETESAYEIPFGECKVVNGPNWNEAEEKFCQSDKGCFAFYSASAPIRLYIADCLDNLPYLLEEHPFLRLALICSPKFYEHPEYHHVQDETGDGEHAEGAICCCSKTEECTSCLRRLRRMKYFPFDIAS